MVFRGRRNKQSDVGDAAVPPPPPSAVTPVDPTANPDTIEGLARKAESERHLALAGIPINDELPRIESESESSRRDETEVAYRAMALMAVAIKGEGHASEDPEVVRGQMAGLIEGLGLHKFFTDDERVFIDHPNPEQHEWIQFSWRYEACWVMHWALGFVDELEPPTSQCDPSKTVGIINNRGRDGYLTDARLRPQAEILDQADLAFRYHWAIREAQIQGGRIPGVQRGVVMERHKALNWLIGVGESWDSVPTDT